MYTYTACTSDNIKKMLQSRQLQITVPLDHRIMHLFADNPMKQ